MTRQRLTDYEAAIIKKLIDRNLENRVIVGMINHFRGDVSKHISPGRVSDIRKGTTKRYLPIKPASEKEVASFIATYQKSTSGPSITQALDPLDKSNIEKYFPICKSSKKFSITESEFIECKKSTSIPIKTVAAFANNKGGYIALGVENGSWEIVGLSDEKINKFDFNNWNQKIRDYFNIGISLQQVVKKYEDKSVLFIHVKEAHTKPVITVKNGDNLKDGTIYYRYPGEDRPITSSDLQRLLEERIRQLSQTVFNKHLKNILEIGPTNAAVLNLKSGELIGQSGSLVIDESTLEQISFIKEGEFVEKEGSPTLRLIGEVKEIAHTVKIRSDTIDDYPLTATQLVNSVKAELPQTKQSEIYAIIKKHKVKANPQFSKYNFRNVDEKEKYNTKRIVSNSTPSIYNTRAVDFVIQKLKENSIQK